MSEKKLIQDVEAFISVCFLSITQINFFISCLHCSNLLLWSTLCWQGWIWGVFGGDCFCLHVSCDSVCVYSIALCVWRLTEALLFVWSLQFIPMPVLYGVFLYMGVASLNGVQVSVMLLLAQQNQTLIFLTPWSLGTRAIPEHDLSSGKSG